MYKMFILYANTGLNESASFRYNPNYKAVEMLRIMLVKTECNDFQISLTHSLLIIEHKEHITCWNWNILPFHGKGELILTLIAAMHLKKVGTGQCLCDCVTQTMIV